MSSSHHLSTPGCLAKSLVLALPEQTELRRIARGLGEAEVAEGVRGQQPPARRALDEAALDQEWLDDLLDGVARLRQSSRDGLDPDRAAAVVERHHGEIAAVHGVEAGDVDLELGERAVGGLAVDRGCA